MSMEINFEKQELVFTIPNSESPLEAQHKGISNRTVGSFYMSDRYQECFLFLNQFKGDFFVDIPLCITQITTLLNQLKQNHLEDSFKSKLMPQFDAIEALKWYVDGEKCKFYKISAPTVNEQKKYLKFDNLDGVYKLLKTLLLGDLTKLIIKKIGANGFIVYIDFIDDLEKKITNRTISKWALLDAKQNNE